MSYPCAFIKKNFNNISIFINFISNLEIEYLLCLFFPAFGAYIKKGQMHKTRYLKHPVYLRFRISISLFNRMQFNILKSGLKKTGRGENLTTDLNQPKPNFSITIVPFEEYIILWLCNRHANKYNKLINSGV